MTVAASSITSGASKTVNQMTRLYGSRMAVCNFGVQTIYKTLYPDGKLPPGMTGRANDMARAWANNPDYWQPIPLSEAQDYANKGYFVVAGYINPVSGGSGHVVVVVPGEEIWANSWKSYVPVVMDTGEGKREKKKAINYSWEPSKKKYVKFYYLKKR